MHHFKFKIERGDSLVIFASDRQLDYRVNEGTQIGFIIGSDESKIKIRCSAVDVLFDIDTGQIWAGLVPIEYSEKELKQFGFPALMAMFAESGWRVEKAMGDAKEFVDRLRNNYLKHVDKITANVIQCNVQPDFVIWNSRLVQRWFAVTAENRESAWNKFQRMIDEKLSEEDWLCMTWREFVEEAKTKENFDFLQYAKYLPIAE